MNLNIPGHYADGKELLVTLVDSSVAALGSRVQNMSPSSERAEGEALQTAAGAAGRGQAICERFPTPSRTSGQTQEWGVTKPWPLEGGGCGSSNHRNKVVQGPHLEWPSR